MTQSPSRHAHQSINVYNLNVLTGRAASLRPSSGVKAVSIDPIWGGGLNGNSPPLAELAQLVTDNGNAADGRREWVCLETGSVVYREI